MGESKEMLITGYLFHLGLAFPPLIKRKSPSKSSQVRLPAIAGMMRVVKESC